VILFALVSGQAGGGQQVALSVARALVENEVRIAALAPDDGPSLERFRSLGARTQVTGPLRSIDVSAARRVGRLLLDWGVDCVYTHTVPSHEIVLVEAARWARRRSVVHRHLIAHLSPKAARRRLQLALWRRALRDASWVVSVSEQVQDEVRRLGGRDSQVVMNGVAIPSSVPVSEPSGATVGFVGRLDPNKRVEDFITAASLVLRNVPNARFSVAGGAAAPGYETECRALAASLGLSGALSFLGPVPDGRRVIAATDVVVLPSALEGHPLALLEAMAMGRAIVATDIPGHRETVTHEVDALLVPPGSPSAIAAAIERLLRDHHERSRLGAAARARAVERFSEQRMVAQLLPLLADDGAFPAAPLASSPDGCVNAALTRR
jgi:glycosyltransferase involved in cell wall biosynthesis